MVGNFKMAAMFKMAALSIIPFEASFLEEGCYLYTNGVRKEEKNKCRDYYTYSLRK